MGARTKSVLILALVSCGGAHASPQGATPRVPPKPSGAVAPAPGAHVEPLVRSAVSSCIADASAGIVWRDDPELAVFWAIDQASRWDDSIGDTYPDFFGGALPKAEGDGAALESYARLRRKYSRETSWPEPDPSRPIDMLPPRMLASDRYAEAFLCAPDPATAGARLGMNDDEQRELGAIFARFRPRLEAHRSPYLAKAKSDLRALAEASRMSEFLDEMRAFYGSEELPRPLYVDLLWTPPSKRHQATAIGAHMVIPLAESTAKDPNELASWLGVVVHEFGHQFLAYVSDDRRYALSTLIAGRGGVLQRRHPNVVDEGMQAAFGNLLFLRERLPQGLDEANVYGFEPELEYPDLIDSMARKIEPLVKDALAKHATLDERFVLGVLEAQASIAPPRLAHMSRVALVYVPSKRDRIDFDGMFWGRSRFATSDAKDFDATSARAPNLARWAVLTSSELASDRDAIVRAMPDVARADADLRAGRFVACVRARARSSGAWDVAVVGRDAAGVRRALIAVQRGVAPESANPLCIK